MNTPSPHLPPSWPHLSRNTLPAETENTYFVFVVLVSVLLWMALIMTIIGAVYGLVIALFVWLGHGLLAAHLRAEAVRVNERQLPALHATFLTVCQQLGVSQPPGLYVLQSGGALNAFATRFAGRDFVVVFSDMLEALGPSSPEIKFILGHELGHLKSKHILKQTLLAPGLFCPLIGPAYRRAWETTCDRYGAFAAQDMDGSLRAMLTLSGGKDQGRLLDAEAFASQHEEERGFFVSLHELSSSYPTLSRRVRDLRALQTGQTAPRPPRNPFAYFFALFIPGGNLGGGGGAANGLIIVVVVGLLAAMAIPAFQKVREASQLKVCLNNERMLSAAFDQAVLENGKPPTSVAELVGPGKYIKQMPVCLNGGTYVIPRGATSGEEIFCTVHGTMENIQRKFNPAAVRH